MSRSPITRWQHCSQNSATESSESEEESDEESGPEGEERKESDRRPPAFAWSKEHTPVRPHAFSPPRRPVHALDNLDTPLDFFHLFLTDEFIEECVNYTNAYAQQRIEDDKENASPNTHSQQWEDATAEELKALIGCLIYMGIVCMNDTRDYWAQATAQPFTTSTFPRDRFLSLLSNLRVSGDVADAEDKLNAE